MLLRIASSNNLEPHNILVQYEMVISSWQDPTSRSVSVDSWSLLMTILPSSKQRRIRSLLLHHGYKPLPSTGPYRFLSPSTRGPSRRSDGTGFVIRSSPYDLLSRSRAPHLHYRPARGQLRTLLEA